MPNWTCRFFAVLAAALISTGASAAPLLYEVHSASLSGPGVGTGFIPAFDRGTGTLKEVDISIVGTMTLTFLPLAGVPPGTAYTANARIAHDFSGVIADTALQPAFTFAAMADGSGQPTQPQVVDFSYGFAFTATSDLIGLVAAAPSSVQATASGGFVTAQRADFVSPFPGGSVPLVQVLAPTMAAGSDPRLQLLPPTVDAVLRVTYAYTPPTAAVPVPAGLPLGLSALGLLAVIRRRRG